MLPTLALFRQTSAASRTAKRFQTGLFDGRAIMSGNNVGEVYGKRSRRSWRPNAQVKAVFSHALGRFLRIRMTAGTLRTIDKVGGLDQYLFRMKPERLGQFGMQLREVVKMEHAKVRAEEEEVARVEREKAQA